jgi:hypothetical protein
MIYVIGHVQDNFIRSILRFLESFWLWFTKHTPLIKVWANNSIIYRNECIFVNERFDSTNSRDSCSYFFANCFRITFPRQFNYYSESFAFANLFNLLIFSENIQTWIRILFNHCLCLSYTLSLSLVGISHFLRFSKSEFTAVSRSVIESPKAVRFVSSANNRGFVLFRHWAKSFMYNKKNSGPKIELVVRHI